jgi:ABC-type dipeptide/oligopeptide/nickel transport system permease subunit
MTQAQLATALPAYGADEWTMAPETPRHVRALRLARRNPIGVIAFIIVASFITLGVVQWVSHDVFHTAVAPYDPTDVDGSLQFQGPSLDHPFGTNQQGQDMLSRVLAGARISFLIGLMAVTIGFIPGAVLGIMSGYFQRWVDYVIQRSGEAWTAFPVLFLYFALITAFGQGLKTIAIVIIISSIFGGSRVLRAVALITKQNDYVEASRSLGATETRILWQHIVPNVMPIIIVGASSVFAASVLAEATLSFLGIGVEPSTPSWGIDINKARDAARYHPYLAIFPGIAISLVVLGFNLLGDSLRDILDPRLRGTLR